MDSAIAKSPRNSASANIQLRNISSVSSTNWAFPAAWNWFSTHSVMAAPDRRSGWQEQALSAIRIRVVHSYFRLLHKTVRYNRVRLRNYALLAIPCIDPPRYFASLLQRLVGILGSDP